MIALVPLFGLGLLSDRRAARLWECLALGAGVGIQVLLFMSTANGRAYMFDPAVVLCVLTVRHLALPLLGPTRQGCLPRRSASASARATSRMSPRCCRFCCSTAPGSCRC